MPRLPILVMAVVLSAAAIAQQGPSMEGFVRDIRESGYPAFWLSYLNSMGRTERLGLIHGTTDNARFCGQLAELYMDRFRSETGRYFCVAAQ